MSYVALVRAYNKYREIIGRLRRDERTWARIDPSIRHELDIFPAKIEEFLTRNGQTFSKQEIHSDPYWLKHRARMDRYLSMRDLLTRDGLVFQEIGKKIRSVLTADSHKALHWYLEGHSIVMWIKRQSEPYVRYHEQADRTTLVALLQQEADTLDPMHVKRYDEGHTLIFKAVPGQPITCSWVPKPTHLPRFASHTGIDFELVEKVIKEGEFK